MLLFVWPMPVNNNMNYISTQKEEKMPAQKMTLGEFKQSLNEMSTTSSGKISRDELFKILTTIGDRFTFQEASQALSLVPNENGWISIEEFAQILFV